MGVVKGLLLREEKCKLNESFRKAQLPGLGHAIHKLDRFHVGSLLNTGFKLTKNAHHRTEIFSRLGREKSRQKKSHFVLGGGGVFLQ